MAVGGRKALQDISPMERIGSDEDLDVFCRPCDRDGPRISAFGFCTNCKEYLCQTCFNHHKKATPSRHHVLLDMDEMATSQIQRLSILEDDPQEDFTKPCLKHTKERIRFYCHRHSSLICSICMLEHRYCCVNYIPEISGNIVDSNEYKDVNKEIDKLVDDSRMVSREAEINANISEQSLANALTEVQKFKEEIRKKTDEIENEIETLQTNMSKEREKMVKNTGKVCDTASKTLEGIYQQITKLNKLKQSNKLFVELKEASPQIQRCKSEISEAAGNIASTTFSFLPNENLLPLIENDTSFGKVTATSDRANIIGKCIGVYSQQNLPDLQKGNPLDLRAGDIKLLDTIGDGTWTTDLQEGSYTLESDQIPVAIRVVEHESSGKVLNAAQLMLKINHRHIIKMIGLCKSDNVMLVLELAPLGLLSVYLKDHREITQTNILELLWQVAIAMEYLERKRIVHRNLAARSVLLMSEHYAKVTDFRMSVEIKDDEDVYEFAEAGKWPVKWYAPECMYFWQFDSKSDVWSYGITLWEATSYGMKPYLTMNGEEVLHFLVDDGRRLPKPKSCKDEVYSLMLQCWEYDKSERPNFQEIATDMFALLRREPRK